MNDRISVLIVDDHPALRMGLASAVSDQADMTVVGQAEDGRSAVEVCREKSPDIVLLDLRMPGTDGFEALPRIQAESKRTRVVVLTTYDLDEDVYAALRAGAKAYLLKDTPMAEILDTIRRVHAGETVIPEHINARFGERKRRPQLSDRELEILRHIVDGRSNKEISSALAVSEETIKTHIKSLFQKLRVNARTEAAVAAIRHGIVKLDT